MYPLLYIDVQNIIYRCTYQAHHIIQEEEINMFAEICIYRDWSLLSKDGMPSFKNNVNAKLAMNLQDERKVEWTGHQRT